MRRLSIIIMIMMIFGMISFTGAIPTSTAEFAGDHDFSLMDSNSTESEETEDESDEEDEEEKETERSEEDEDSDDDGVEDEKEEAFERELEVEIDEEKFKIKSSLKNDENKDEFELEFDAGSDDEAEIKLKFKSEAGNSETELEYKVEFDEIIEFVDEGVPGYDNETILTEYEIGKTGWLDMQYDFDESSGLHTIVATTSDGVFSLVMRLSNTYVQDAGVVISPTSLKIDVHIDGFDYTSTDSKLAIKTHLKSSSEMEVDDETEDEFEGIASDESEVELSSGTTSAFFSWSDLAIADGKTVDVLSTTLSDSSDEEGEISSKIYYTFDVTGASEIVWDPKVGVVSEASKANLAALQSINSNALPLPGFEFVAFVSVLGLAFVLRRKHR